MIEDIRRTLWATADKLRANMDAGEYKHLVLGLIFVKYIPDTFQAKRAELTARFVDPADEYFLEDSAPEALAAELEDRDYYREVNVFWVPQSARWEALRAAAKQTDIGKRIDEALLLIEAENPKLKGILDKRFARAQLPDGKLGELVDLVSTIGFGASAREARDVLGVVYEYFLGMFASAEGKRGGQFYTPRSIVKTLVAVLAPHYSKVYDPCCGSGGMFVQSEEFIEAHGGKLGDVAIFGQEANPTTWRLAAMTLAIRGIDFNLGREPNDSFTKDQFPDLRADFVLANPPFNISDWYLQRHSCASFPTSGRPCIVQLLRTRVKASPSPPSATPYFPARSPADYACPTPTRSAEQGLGKRPSWRRRIARQLSEPYHSPERKEVPMSESTITAKGQTTVPRQVREQIGAGPGTRLVWHVMPDGSLIVRAKTHSILDLKGMLKSPKKKPVPIEDMNAWR